MYEYENMFFAQNILINVPYIYAITNTVCALCIYILEQYIWLGQYLPLGHRLNRSFAAPKVNFAFSRERCLHANNARVID